MIRIAPEAPPEAAEEKKRAREVIISNITTFFIAVAVIRLGIFHMFQNDILILHIGIVSKMSFCFIVPHAIKLLNE